MVSESTQPEAKTLLVVDGIDDAADGVRLLTLRAADGADLPEWAPGAHLDLVLGGVSDAELKDAAQGDLPEHDPFDELIRQYSLCGDPADRSRFQVAVLRESESRGGSSYIHETLKVGDELVSYGPRNHFELRKAPTYVFVAGGIGITPILTMVRAAQAQGKNWHLYYLGRSGATMAFRDELASFGDRVTFWPKADKGAFDLAATLAREFYDVDKLSTFFELVQQDPIVSQVKLIAEPWDIGLGGYQVGGFPPGWSEWNDVYRKTMRRYWRGEGNLLGELASALTGSALQFHHDGRAPQASVNHVTVHDGFTLGDLVSYEHKHNEANKEDNRDGSDDNNSLNCGDEGPTDDAKILACRRLIRRNQLASLLLAMGVPLMLAGDEAANTQGGNNNAYCQDDEIGWVNWSKLGSEDDDTEFVGAMTELRQRFGQLRTRHWLEGKNGDDTHDVIWLRPDAAENRRIGTLGVEHG